MMRYLLCAFVLLAFSGHTVSAAVFQYVASLTTNKGTSEAFLWIPPDAAHVRGVVLAGMTLMEREFVKDERIRQACADEQLALVFLKCGLGKVEPQLVLDTLAEVSGYGELSTAPLMFVGHSAGGPQAKARASEMAERCFGLVQYRGGSPGGSETVPPGIPVLMMLGQFDEFGRTMRDKTGRETWMGGRDTMAVFRAAHAHNLGSLVVEPGAGHFAWSARNARYLALFIRKAAQARIPEKWPADAEKPVVLRRIDPRHGWLTDLSVETPHPEIACYSEYRGDTCNAAWHFDGEMARATVDYHVGLSGRDDQFIRWSDPHWVDAGARFFFTRLTWTGDGQTLAVHPVYSEEYPGQYNGHGPIWTLAGEPVGHSSVPIHIRPVGGPMMATGPNSLRIKYDNLAPATDRARVTFMAYSEGDAKYRYTEHVGMMPRGFRGLDRGTPQSITFPPLGSMTLGDTSVPLIATSDSGLPVEYYVAYGPATVVDAKLELTDIPSRATFPITVAVVAYQFGRGIEPLVQTAQPVTRTFHVHKQ